MDTPRKQNWSAIAARMAELREQHRRSQRECAEALGVAQTSYSDMESAKIRIRRRDLAALASYYGLSLREAFPMFDDPVECVA